MGVIIDEYLEYPRSIVAILRFVFGEMKPLFSLSGLSHFDIQPLDVKQGSGNVDGPQESIHYYYALRLNCLPAPEKIKSFNVRVAAISEPGQATRVEVDECYEIITSKAAEEESNLLSHATTVLMEFIFGDMQKLFPFLVFDSFDTRRVSDAKAGSDFALTIDRNGHCYYYFEVHLNCHPLPEGEKILLVRIEVTLEPHGIQVKPAGYHVLPDRKWVEKTTNLSTLDFNQTVPV